MAVPCPVRSAGEDSCPSSAAPAAETRPQQAKRKPSSKRALQHGGALLQAPPLLLMWPRPSTNSAPSPRPQAPHRSAAAPSSRRSTSADRSLT